jgi:tetratricopeptide (TPR) repeat protein
LFTGSKRKFRVKSRGISTVARAKRGAVKEQAPSAPAFNDLCVDRPMYRRYVVVAVAAAALIYAFVAGFRTVHDYDIGWQLATGRWIVHHHQIPSTDVLSYTAKGKPWIYPILSGLIFYTLHSIGGYAALTWLTASASLVTIYLLTRERIAATGVLAIIAVPVIMTRLDPRADLFSTVFFAGLLSILWAYHGTGRGKLWLLPILFLLWVNLHWGFVAGLGLCAGYILGEACEMLFATRRNEAKSRLRKALPWLMASALVTFVNPWGIAFYRNVFTWINDLIAGASAKTAGIITLEYTPLKFNVSALEGALAWRNPGISAIWWLLGIACVATVMSVLRKRYGAAILLIVSAAAAIHAYRFQAMFACVVVIVAGAVLSDSLEAMVAGWRQRSGGRSTMVMQVAAIVCAFFIALAGIRSFDLVSNRYYASTLPFEFGTGLSWWYPEKALAFVEREHLAGNIFNPLVLGGYLQWRLPQHPDFIDGRGRPFEGEVFQASQWLPLQGPESRAWQDASDKYGFSMIVVSISRISGLEYFPKLQEFCRGQAWRPIYLDEVSAVFLRHTPETKSLIDRLQVNCETVRFSPPIANKLSMRERADLFNFWTNSAVVYLALARPQDALEATDAAGQLFEASSQLHLERGVAFKMLNNIGEAQKEFRKSVELEPEETNLYELAKLLWIEQHSDEATAALRRAAELSLQPEGLYLDLAYAEIKQRNPNDALAAFDKAARFDTQQDDSMPEVAELHARVAEGRASAWMLLGDTRRAAEFELEAVKLTPQNAHRWEELGALYQSLGRASDAERAIQKSQELSTHAAENR